MNKATDTLKKVKTLLGLEVSLEAMKLDNGTVLEAEKFEAGEPVFIVTEDEKVALPVGEYLLEDGSMLIVKEEGIIAEIGAVEVEEVIEAEVIEEEVIEEKVETAVVEDWAGMEKRIQNLEDAISKIKELIGEKKEVEAEEVIEEEVEELATELSKPSTTPLKHSPKEAEAFKPKFNFNKNRVQTPYEQIVGKINKFKNK